jgi:hypothetical protein
VGSCVVSGKAYVRAIPIIKDQAACKDRVFIDLHACSYGCVVKAGPTEQEQQQPFAVCEGVHTRAEGMQVRIQVQLLHGVPVFGVFADWVRLVNFDMCVCVCVCVCVYIYIYIHR